jgi:hypothetical protein
MYPTSAKFAAKTIVAFFWLITIPKCLMTKLGKIFEPAKLEDLSYDELYRWAQSQANSHPGMVKEIMATISRNR